MQFHTLYYQVLTLNLQYYNVNTLEFKSSIVESCTSMLLFCGFVVVLSGSGLNEFIIEAYFAHCVQGCVVCCVFRTLSDRLVRVMCVCVCVCSV